MNAAHLTSINKTSIMNRPIHPKPIIVIFFCIFYLTAHCQQDLFNLDFRFAEPLHFQWKATQIPIIKIDSTQLIQGKHPLMILPEEMQHSLLTFGNNNPILLNLYQTFLIPAEYANDTAIVSLHIRPIEMNKVYLQVRGMNSQQEFLRTDSANVPNDDEWQTVRCSLPLKDVRYLTIGMVGNSKMKNRFDFRPSKVYLDRVTVHIAGQTIEQIHRDNPFLIKRPDRLLDLAYMNVFDEPDKSILQKTGLQDKRIIALGETVHGSSTINDNVFSIIKNSILYDNCRLVLLERDMGNGLKMNLYIHGKLPESAIKELIHDTDGILMNLHSLENLLIWLREYNKTAITKVNLLGIEGFYNNQINAMFDYLYAFYNDMNRNLFYPILTELNRIEYESVLDLAEQDKKKLTELMGYHEYELLVDVLKGIIRTHNDTRTIGRIFHARLNRDLYLYENARNFIDKLLRKDEKAIIYAHYGHAQKKEQTEGTFPYMQTMGSRLSEKFKDDYAVIALTVGSGEIQTRSLQYTDSICAYQLDTLPDYSLESVLMESAQDSIFIFVQTLDDSVYCTRSIGNAPRWNRNYEYTNLHACADGIIYFKNSRRSEEERSFDSLRIYKARQRRKIIESIIPIDNEKQ